MLNAVDVSKLQPKGERVIVTLKKLPNFSASGFKRKESNEDVTTPENPPNYFGKVDEVGELVKGVKKGDYILFHQLAGYHILTKGKELTKIIKGINVVAVSKKSGMKVEDIRLVKSRVLVDTKEELIEDKSESGFVKNTGPLKSLRQRDLNRGVIVQLSDEAKEEGYKIGDVVYFGIEVGHIVPEIKGDSEYRVLYHQDIETVLSI